MACPDDPGSIAKSREPLASVVALCASILALDENASSALELARRVEWLLAHQSGLARKSFHAGAAAIDAAALASTGKRLARLDIPAREQFLERLGSHASAAAPIEAMKALILLVAGADRAADAALSKATAAEPARPDPEELRVIPSAEWPSVHHCDAIVVGTGAGGAMVARTLARAGMSTVLVEEGGQHLVSEFRTDTPLERFANLYRDGGATVMLGNPAVLLPIGIGVGGTTLVNSGTCYRPPQRVLKRWLDREGLILADPDRISAYLEEVESTLQIAAVPRDVMGRNGELSLLGAENLGWDAHPMMRNAPGCGGTCQCSIGCPRNAKLGVHLNALPSACAAGAVVVSDARVERVLFDTDPTMHTAGKLRATLRALGTRTHQRVAAGILARRKDGSYFEIFSQRVVVAAGATETPPLLRRSAVQRHPMMGRNLAVHPALSVAGYFDEAVDASDGVLQSAAIEELHESDQILIEATAAPPGMGSMMLPGYGRSLLAQLDRADHLAFLGAMVADAPSGRVIGSKRPLLLYNLDHRDTLRLLKAVRSTSQVLLAAGAQEVITGIRHAKTVRNERELDEVLLQANPRDLHLAAFHPTGTMAAGSDPERHPVDADGALRGATGLWIADASILPSCPEVNPQVSIMALALAVADRVLSMS
ncbi:MAG: GMC family oxidoreductase N-terminal domain-containing protein [Acidimicrobiales bacterium]